MWIQFNQNPLGKNVGDCAVRAVSVALNMDWNTAYTQLTLQGYAMADMPSSNAVIGALLKQNGFRKGTLPDECCTVGEFANANASGIFVVFMDKHVATIKDGNVYDAWDCTNEVPIFYWEG